MFTFTISNVLFEFRVWPRFWKDLIHSLNFLIKLSRVYPTVKQNWLYLQRIIENYKIHRQKHIHLLGIWRKTTRTANSCWLGSGVLDKSLAFALMGMSTKISCKWDTLGQDIVAVRKSCACRVSQCNPLLLPIVFWTILPGQAFSWFVNRVSGPQKWSFPYFFFNWSLPIDL